MIIVFGSNVLDLFFPRENLPPKDQAVFIDNHVEEAGGKGANQAIAASMAGSKVRFYGALGEGGHGRQMYKNLAKRGVDVSGITFLDMPSGLATIFVDEEDGTHRIVVSQGANLFADQSTVSDEVLNEDSIVLVQGELPIKQTEELVVRAKAKNATTVLNFAPATQTLSERFLQNLDFLIVNEHEADLVGKSFNIDTSDKEKFAETLYDKFQVCVVVTLGPEGSLLFNEDGIKKVNSLQIDATDTVGAGDAHAGFFCAALDQGEDLSDALRWASAAGSLTCMNVGAQSALPSKEDLDKELEKISIS